MKIADTSGDNGTAPSDPKPPAKMTAVQYEHSGNFPHLLEQIHSTLLVSTYQAGKLVAVGAKEGKAIFSFHDFERMMGLAVSQDKIAIGARRMVYLLNRARDLAWRMEPQGRYDDCWLTRSAHVTGNVLIHEMEWGEGGLWFVNTLFSCICTMDPDNSFSPRWKPPFISALVSEDRCHLNGMALENGLPKYASAIAETDVAAGWRENKAKTGCVMEVPSGNVVARGFAMAHSPRLYGGGLYALDSGRGQIAKIDLTSGTYAPACDELPGYARGLCFSGNLAFVGLSKIRETNVFGGLPISERRSELQCGVAIVDMFTGKLVSMLKFGSGVEEIFDVRLLPGSLSPAIQGPDPEADQQTPIWLASQPRWL